MSGLHDLHILFLCSLLFAHQSLAGRVHHINQEENAGSSADPPTPFQFHLPYVYHPPKNGVKLQPYDAVHIIEDRDRGFYGTTATFDIYGYNLTDGQATGAAVWINNFVGDYDQDISEIGVGWVVWPSYFNDSRTYFYTTWTKDYHYRTGCLNLDSLGLQLESGSPIFPGDVLAPVSNLSDYGEGSFLIIKLMKEANGDWTLLVGFNDILWVIGYFPASLFDGKFTKATQILMGGHALRSETTTPPVMGSGEYPDSKKKAAVVTNIQVYGEEGRGYSIVRDRPADVTDAKLYSVSPIYAGVFHYGGPGGKN